MADAAPETTTRETYQLAQISIEIEAGSRPSGDLWLDLSISLPNGGRSLRHIFPNIGKDDWRSFLVSLDTDYIGGKLFGYARHEPDFALTCKRIRSWMRSEDCVDLAMARDIRGSIARAEDAFRADPEARMYERVHVDSLLSSLAQTHGLDDVGGFMGKRETHALKRFMAKVWQPFTASLRQELAREAPETSSEPDICPEL